MKIIYYELNSSHSLYLVTENQVSSFKNLANEHHNISCLLGKNEIDFYSWRIALDLFFLLQQNHNRPIYLTERGMLSPVHHFFINFFIKSPHFQKLLHTSVINDHNCFVFAVYFASTFKKLFKEVFIVRNENLDWTYILGDLNHYTNTQDSKMIPSIEMLKMQAEAIKLLKTHMIHNNVLEKKIEKTIFEAKNLCYILSSQLEEELGWTVKQSN